MINSSGGCGIALYCGAAHQKAHRSIHKVSCDIVKKSRDDLAREEKSLRKHKGDSETPPNPFESAVGMFYFWKGTRPYMQARYDYITAALNIRTGEGVQAALDSSLESLRLCRADNQAVRSGVPAMYLRLGRDQDAFDFIKWYAVNQSSYNWSDMKLPFLDLHGADALESVEEHTTDFMDLSFLVALTLLKIRLLEDINMLQTYMEKCGERSYETKMKWIRKEALSDVLYGRRDIVELADYKALVNNLENQVCRMLVRVDKANQFWWPALVDPGKYANATPTGYTFGSEAETVVVFRNSWYSWSECPPALILAQEYAGRRASGVS